MFSIIIRFAARLLANETFQMVLLVENLLLSLVNNAALCINDDDLSSYFLSKEYLRNETVLV